MAIKSIFSFLSTPLRFRIPSFLTFLWAFFILVLIIFIAVSFVSHEKYIYFWDLSTYFTYFSDLGEKSLATPLRALDGVFISIRKADYNQSGVVPLLPFYYLFGSSRMSYISAITVIYVFPVILLFPILLRTISGLSETADENKDIGLHALLMLSIALLPQLWVPIFLGYIDVAGILVIFLILFLYFRKEFVNQSIGNLIAIGMLLSLLIIVRRWYAYWVVGFFIAIIVQQFIQIILGVDRRTTAKILLKHIVITGISAVLTFFVLCTQVAIRMLKTDYADIYSAYKSQEGFFKQLTRFTDHFGLFVLILISAGVVTGFAVKSLRKQTIFLSTLFLTTLIIFLQTQDLDFHHYNWVIPILTIFIGIILMQIYVRLDRREMRIGLIAIFAIVWAINFAIVFIPGADPVLAMVRPVLSTTRLYPKVRNDLDELRRLLVTLRTELNGTNSKIYVLSSSLSLNSGLLQNASYAFEPELRSVRKNILDTNDVDKRDGFPFQMYSADLIVVAAPAGYHLRPEDQQVIGLLAEYIVSGKSIGEAYIKLPYEFRLEDEHDVYIYRRTQKFTSTQLTQIADVFTKIYPEHRTQFEIDPMKLAEYTQ